MVVDDLIDLEGKTLWGKQFFLAPLREDNYEFEASIFLNTKQKSLCTVSIMVVSQALGLMMNRTWISMFSLLEIKPRNTEYKYK